MASAKKYTGSPSPQSDGAIAKSSTLTPPADCKRRPKLSASVPSGTASVVNERRTHWPGDAAANGYPWSTGSTRGRS
jgi:hypothetical protein